MMLIKTNGETLDLSSGFSIEIEDSNPIFNDRGSQSIPATVPATSRNLKTFDFPTRIDSALDPNGISRMTVEINDGAYMRRGTLNITEANVKEGISFNIGFDNSTAYVEWCGRRLAELSDLPVHEADTERFSNNAVEALIDELSLIYRGTATSDDFAIFPMALNKEEVNSGFGKTYWELVNIPDSDGILAQPAKIDRVVDGTVTQVNVPAGYGVTPFLRVWRILELIFSDLGISIESNPFKTGELAYLVVLNNSADTICNGSINYAELMPDVTIEEFMNALWVRFGLVYNINFDRRTVKLRFIRDIIKDSSATDILPYTSGFEKLNFSEARYIKLSAGTSIDGASPANERFEDFTRGLETTKVHIGADVNNWTNTGTSDAPVWDGDVRDDWYDPDDPDPENPEPDQPDPDVPDPDPEEPEDYEPYSMLRAQEARNKSTMVASTLAREFVTGNWFRLDAGNGAVQKSSSSFFNWDPKTQGASPLDLNSVDECVPLMSVDTSGTTVSNTFKDFCPAFLVGARHYHTFIKGNKTELNDNISTPLAFMFAYPVNGKTIGRLNGESSNGLPIKLKNGSSPKLSLYFQFKDGLFSNFWKEYDEILRHASFSAEVNIIIPKHLILSLDMFRPVMLRGIRCLIDSVSYSLPQGNEIMATLKLNAIRPRGNYDITTEQNIPAFASASRHLEWRLKSENFSSALDSDAAKQEAIRNFIKNTGYKAHGEPGAWYFVGAESAIFKNIARYGSTWKTDRHLPEATAADLTMTRTYKARISYDIYEIFDMSREPGEIDRELSEIPLDVASAIVDYSVILKSVWVID